ncbi:MAG: acyl carrier protein [Proteobacteria bacterium]|nr:acyl carrier protein [Pseudomonadota bacterium]
MEDESLRQSIAKFMSETFLFEFDTTVTPDTNLFDAGLIDSFGFTQLIAFLEETFAITLTEDDFASDDISSLNGIVRIVNRLRAAPGQLSSNTP